MIENRKTDALPKPKSGSGEAMCMELPRFEAPLFMLPAMFWAFAENQVAGGKKALETLSTASKEAYSTSLRDLNEYGQRIVQAGHRDADAVYDCCRELIAAKSLPEVMDVWTTHTSRQFNAMSNRTSQLWALSWKVAFGMSHTLARSK